MRSLVGDQMLKMAVYKLQTQVCDSIMFDEFMFVLLVEFRIS